MNIPAGITIALVTVAALVSGFVFHSQRVEPDSRDGVPSIVCDTAGIPQITARAAYVLDVTSGDVLYEKAALNPMPLASLTKVMTVLVASRVLDPESDIVISQDALASEGDAGLVLGEVWRAQDLIDFTLITSANDGARALARASMEHTGESSDAFVERMNTLASTLGLSQTYFLNETGLDVNTRVAGAYGSARDVAHLLGYLYQEAGEVVFASSRATHTFVSRSGITHRAENTSSTAGHLPGQAISKTGFTDLAGGNLGIVAEILVGKPVALVVLGSTREERDRDIETLYRATRDLLKRDTLCPTE